MVLPNLKHCLIKKKKTGNWHVHWETITASAISALKFCEITVCTSKLCMASVFRAMRLIGWYHWSNLTHQVSSDSRFYCPKRLTHTHTHTHTLIKVKIKTPFLHHCPGQRTFSVDCLSLRQATERDPSLRHHGAFLSRRMHGWVETASLGCPSSKSKEKKMTDNLEKKARPTGQRLPEFCESQ